MGNRIKYIFLLLAIPLRLAAADYTVSLATNACGDLKTYTIPEGEQLVLHAHPIAGYTFSQWSDGNTDNPRIVTVTSNASYTAEFVAMSPMPTIHNVVVSADGCVSKEIKVEDGSAVKIYPHAKLGYTFSQWSDGNTDNPRIAIINTDATFVAQFKELDETAPDGMFTIVVKADGCGTALTQNISTDTEVKLYAHPEEYNYFVKWSDGNTDNPRTVIVTANKEYVAVFDLIKYTVKFVDADGTQIGETQIVKGGENATPPTPPAREGYTFVGWIGTYTNVKSDATIYASYSRINEPSTTQPGSLPGLFSVAPDKQVYFSQGNLQYMGATQTWRFAENQYDTVGIFNNNISSSYNGWIDMFGWGTSGWNSGAKEYQPYSTSTTDADYYPGNTYSNDLTGPYMNANWGIYNAIYNGGNKTGLWRTLTQDEWQYLYSNRANADSKHAYATINGIGGYILLPDNWILPNGLTFDASGTNATANQYTKEQWKLMEQNGAVFLPAAGYRDGSEAKGVLKLGDYWLSTSYDADNACRVFFKSDKSPESYPCELRHYGFSVRLVGPAPSYKIAVNPSNDLMGSTSGSGTYNYGESVQISANPNDCFHFTQWSDGNTDNPRTVTVNSDATYTAIFKAEQYTIYVESADETLGTVSIEINQ